MLYRAAVSLTLVRQRETAQLLSVFRMRRLILVQIFLGHVVLGHFMGVNFPPFLISGVFNPLDYFSLERVSFFQ